MAIFEGPARFFWVVVGKLIVCWRTREKAMSCKLWITEYVLFPVAWEDIGLGPISGLWGVSFGAMQSKPVTAVSGASEALT